jgi:hypothetical protein
MTNTDFLDYKFRIKHFPSISQRPLNSLYTSGQSFLTNKILFKPSDQFVISYHQNTDAYSCFVCWLYLPLSWFEHILYREKDWAWQRARQSPVHNENVFIISYNEFRHWLTLRANTNLSKRLCHWSWSVTCIRSKLLFIILFTSDKSGLTTLSHVVFGFLGVCSQVWWICLVLVWVGIHLLVNGNYKTNVNADLFAHLLIV